SCAAAQLDWTELPQSLTSHGAAECFGGHLFRAKDDGRRRSSHRRPPCAQARRTGSFLRRLAPRLDHQEVGRGQRRMPGELGEQDRAVMIAAAIGVVIKVAVVLVVDNALRRGRRVRADMKLGRRQRTKVIDVSEGYLTELDQVADGAESMNNVE